MGLRQTMNENPVVTSAVVGVITLAALFFAGRAACGSRSTGGGGPEQAFYTSDEGKTWFPDDREKLPPIKDKDGKDAYRVKLYKCKTGKEFVNHMEKYSDATKATLESSSGGSADMLRALALEIKRPGDKGWVTMQTGPQQYSKVTIVKKCPDGSEPTIVEPPK